MYLTITNVISTCVGNRALIVLIKTRLNIGNIPCTEANPRWHIMRTKAAILICEKKQVVLINIKVSIE